MHLRRGQLQRWQASLLWVVRYLQTEDTLVLAQTLGLLCRSIDVRAAAVGTANRFSSGFDWLVARKWAFAEVPTVEWVF